MFPSEPRQSRWTADWTVKPQQWKGLCICAAEGVIWSAKPSLWILARVLISNDVARASHFSPWCLTSAPSSLLRLTIIPGFPFIQGPPTPRQLWRFNALFLLLLPLQPRQERLPSPFPICSVCSSLGFFVLFCFFCFCFEKGKTVPKQVS